MSSSRDDDRTGARPRLDDRAGFLLAQLGAARHRGLAERLAPLGLLPRHFGTLSHLAAHEGASQQALGRALRMHPSAVVALVDELEDRGLAERRRDPDDRRAYQLHLTPGGRETLGELERLAREEEDALLVPLDPSERRQLIALLRRLARAEGLVPGVHPDLRSDTGAG